MKQEMRVIKIIAATFPINTQNLLYFEDKIAVMINVLSPISEIVVEMKDPKNEPCFYKMYSSLN